MIGYVTMGVRDLERAKSFYTELLADLGVSILADMDRIVYLGNSMDTPMLGLCLPFNGEPSQPGNGNMVAIKAGSKENVDKLHKKALELGASCDGAPGQRIPDVFYGAYIRDQDSNKVAFYEFG